MALPAYDQCIKASHVFNLLDARGVISVTERQSYILRVRELAKACGEAWLKTEGGGADMSETPEIGGREPHGRRRRGRQELLVVRLRALQVAAVLRRLAQGHGVRAARIQAGDDRRGLVLHLQAHRQRRRSATAAIRSSYVMPDLLLEFFSEEIPARMQARAAEDLKKLVTDRLVAAGLTYEGAKAFATPRRLALAVAGVPARQPDMKEERKGPARRRARAGDRGLPEGRGACLDRSRPRCSPTRRATSTSR